MVVLQEAIESVCAYFGVSSMQLLVEHLINGVLERSTTGRKKVGHLLGLLLKRNILLRKQFEAGLKSVLQIADVLLVDIPKIWDYLGELIGNFSFVVATNTLKNPLAIIGNGSVTNYQLGATSEAVALLLLTWVVGRAFASNEVVLYRIYRLCVMLPVST